MGHFRLGCVNLAYFISYLDRLGFSVVRSLLGLLNPFNTGYE